jgi:flagellar M-ring protein FliF
MNQNLIRFGKQLTEIWKQLGLNQRISIVLTAVVVMGGMLGLAFWSNRPDYALLYGKLDDAEASKVTQALDEAKVAYKMSKGGGAIMVPSDKVYQLRAQLASKGIPRGEGVGFEIFDKPNFGISDFVQRANYVRAIQGELSRTISQFEGVASTRVMIVIPENRLLVDHQKKPTASVFIRIKGNSPLPPQSVASIRQLVSTAVEGLQVSSVSVVDNLGNVLSDNTENDSLAGLSGNQLKARQEYEQYLAKKAQGMLEKVLGEGQAVVRVSADINWDSITRVEEKFDPEGVVARSETINDETSDTITGEASSAATPPGGGNSTTNTPAASTPTSNARTKKKTITNQNEINRTTSNLLMNPGGLKRISAAVFVATKVEGTGTSRKVTQRTPEELQKLKRIVQSALGIVENGDPSRKDEITLEEMPFNDRVVVEMTQQLERQDKQEFYWSLLKNVGYPIAALGVLFALVRMLKKTAANEIPIGIPLDGMNGEGNGNGHGSNGWPKDVVTVEVLNQLIRENPANMTQAVRSWMNRGKPLN